ncbi:MAG: VWA domain-containing protein [Deltaproteobacteria bacterium]|nr:VWA domain-containing protein [Deltaproteobacteria bacterium]
MKIFKMTTVTLWLAAICFMGLAACGAGGVSSDAIGGDDDGEWDTGNDLDADADSDTDSDGDSDPSDTGTDTGTDTGKCDPEELKTYWLSADDSNSMASPTIARWMIEAGMWPSFSVRTYEFLNYFRFDYAAPAAGHVAVHEELAPVEGEPGAYSLQIGVRAPDGSSLERRPLNLVFSLDDSGSMEGSPIERQKQVCRDIAHNLTKGDVVSIVTWNQDANVLLSSHVVDGPDDEVLLGKINGLLADGTTDLHQGLVKAYELASENASGSRMNRVILVSDGQANTGITDHDIIADGAKDSEKEGIYLVGVGVGNGYDDTLMDDVTDAGKGAYVFIDTLAEADRMFDDPDRLISLLDIAARNVQVELELPAGWLMREFHGEEYSENPQEVEPQHLAPSDEMVFNQIVSSCSEPGEDAAQAITVRAHYLDPATREPKTDETTATVASLLEGTNRSLVKGNAIVAYAEALKTIQQTGPGPAADQVLAATLAVVKAADKTLGGDADLGQIEALILILRSKI